MAATKWAPLPPRPCHWAMKPLDSAETGSKTLADGRLELSIRHDIIADIAKNDDTGITLSVRKFGAEVMFFLPALDAAHASRPSPVPGEG